MLSIDLTGKVTSVADADSLPTMTFEKLKGSEILIAQRLAGKDSRPLPRILGEHGRETDRRVHMFRFLRRD